MQLTQAVLGVTIDTRDAKLKLNELHTSFYRLFQAVSTASVTAFSAAQSRITELADSIAVALNKFQGFQSMMVAVNGDMKAARAEFDFLRQIAEQLGVRIDSLELNYSKLRVALKGVSDGADIAKNVFTGVSMAARTMHSSAEDTRLMFYAVTQMASKGVISMEELRRQLGEKLPGVMDIAARAIGTTTQKLEEMVRTGKMQSIPFLRAFGPALIEAFKDSAAAAGGTLDAALARFQNLWTNFIVVLNDSGAAQAMAKTVDALRAKLNDNAIFEAFAEIIKKMANSFTDWINNLTRDDIAKIIDGIAKAFTAFTEAATSTASVLVKLVGHVRELVIMLIALRGAQLGAQIGGKSPLTALIGGLVGGGLSAYVASEGLDYLFERNVQQVQAATAAGVKARQAELDAASEIAKLNQQSRTLAGGTIAEQFGFEKGGLANQLANISQDKVNALGKLLANYQGEKLLKKKQDLEKQAIAILYDRPIVPDVSRDLMGGGGKKSAEQTLAEKAAKAVQMSKEAAFAASDATTELEKMQLKIATGGAYAKFDDATKKQLLYWAQLKDLIKQAEIEREQYAKTEEFALKKQYDESVRLANLAKQLTTKADPHQELVNRLTDLNKMANLNLITPDQAEILAGEARKEFNKDTKTGKADQIVQNLREEVEVLRLSNEEREIRKNLFDLEASGIERASAEWYKYVDQIKQLSAEKVKLEQVERITSDLGQTFTSMFEQAVIQGKEFRQVLKGIAQDILAIATRELVSKNIYAGAKLLFNSVAKFFTGGAGGDALIGDFPSVDVGHSGGLVGSLTQRRAVNPLMFMGAPRFHNGLMADEYPAILQRGERIIPRNGKVGSSINITVPVTVGEGGNSAQSAEQAKALSTVLQGVVKQEIIKQTRPGGVLYG